MNCPHCQVPMFLKSAGGTKLKARTNILVVHPQSGDAEINCTSCGGAVVVGQLSVSLRKARPRLVIRPA
ncbi:MAG TPA: hypothetical protein VIK52_11065 [Opitutaceae bacterium]